MVKNINKQPLPSSMRFVEGIRDFSNDQSSYVFEMEAWIDSILNISVSEDAHQKLEKIFDNLQSIVVEREFDEDEEVFYHKNGIYAIIKIGVNTDYFLLDYDADDRGEKESILRQKYYKKFLAKELKQMARRGYPDWTFLGNHWDWENIEKDDKSNLALSDEEVVTLKSAKYPFFINGLAGSGKSTILYYLYANAYAYKLNKAKDSKLLFLSYSNALVENAKANIAVLLREKGLGTDNNDEYKEFKESIQGFQYFLRNHFLDDQERIEKFAEDKHIDYNDFCVWFSQGHYYNYTKISSNLAWSVIRSIITGQEKIVDSQSYRNEFNRNDHFVSVTEFEKIYEDIYLKYRNYKLDNNKWDDLDLIRYILENKKIEPEYNVIYCDEAQDFTYIENKVILSLSKYSNYDLSTYKELPIAFAGDPNQTISPTGFSWLRTKSNFSEFFSNNVGDFLKLGNKTLNNNYRSQWRIVQFSNTIQLLKKLRLKSNDVVKPQEKWNKEDDKKHIFFVEIGKVDNQEIKDLLDLFPCIITGHDGLFKHNGSNDSHNCDYIPEKLNNDVLLSDIDKGLVNTVINVKGLEYRNVAMYNFVENFLAEKNGELLDKFINNPNYFDEEKHISDKFELLHFITKLYIAITRAKEILVIVDTERAYNAFWKYFYNESECCIIDKLIPPELIEWENKVSGIDSLFDRNLFSNIKSVEKQKIFIDEANEKFETARANGVADTMYRIASLYKKGGDKEREKLCRAYALSFEKKYELAGDCLNGNQYEDLKSTFYWKGKCWRKYYELNQKKTNIKTVVSGFMLGTYQLKNVYEKKEDLLTELKKVFDDSWIAVGAKIKEEALKTTEYIGQVIDLVKDLKDYYASFKSVIPELYYNTQDYGEACKFWDMYGIGSAINKYNYSRWKIANYKDDYNEIIEYQSKLENDDFLSNNKVSSIWDKYGCNAQYTKYNLNKISSEIIFELLLRKDYNGAIKFGYPIKDKLERLYNASPYAFLDKYVFAPNFTNEKFEDLLLVVDSRISSIPESHIKTIVKQFNNKAYKFFGLQINGTRILKNKKNKKCCIDALSSLREQTFFQKDYGSCLLDLLFDSDYKYETANRYQSKIITALSSDNYRNEYWDYDSLYDNDDYFNAVKIDKDEYKIIVNNIFDYLEKTIPLLNNEKVEVIEELCSILEHLSTIRTDALNKSEKNNKSDDYMKVFKLIDFYDNCLKNTKNKSLSTYFKIRQIVDNLFSKQYIVFDSFYKELSKNEINTTQFLESLGRNDFGTFIVKSMGRKEIQEFDNKEFFDSVAKSLYKYKITISEIGGNQNALNFTRNNLLSLAKKYTREAIVADIPDVYLIKLYSFVIEKTSASKDIVEYFESICKESNIFSNIQLALYLKERALHYWTNIEGGKKFEQKKAEYGVAKQSTDYIHWKYPKIELGVSNSDFEKIESIVKETEIEDSGISVNPQGGRLKKVEFFDEDEIATVKKGKLDDDFDDTKVVTDSETKFTILGKLHVTIISENEVHIRYKNKRYKVTF